MSEEILNKLISVLNTYSGRDKALRSIYFTLVIISNRLSKSRAELSRNLFAFAKQLSLTRLVGRQLNWFQLFKSFRTIPKQLCQIFSQLSFDHQLSDSGDNKVENNSKEKLSKHQTDLESKNKLFQLISAFLTLCRAICIQPTTKSVGKLVDDFLTAVITIFYAINSIVEFLAWIADSKLVRLEAARWFRYSLYCWIAALITSVVKFIRRVHSIGWTKMSTWPDQLTLLGLSADLIAALNMVPGVRLRRHGKKLTLMQSASLSLIASTIGLYNLFE